ncbi:MAG: DegT/DnrJ/EryC1/StrS family aminotransferase, partial [bacterium]|nr:DegT/DnrJ/EryC1/StrS family aminotransferase [bacterium]MDW8163716.1 DegT/DnrJ/EryC1/StrS family aminotransferase [Candidatus Omnitrophota bacterium]
FHPVKIITTGEGGMVVTNSKYFYEKLKRFRNHGIFSFPRERMKQKMMFYKMEEIGYNYRITDFQCALGISQIKKINKFLEKRNEIAEYYNKKLKEIEEIEILKKEKDVYHAYHLYVVKLTSEKIRNKLFFHLREKKIGVNIHYYPVHLQPFYVKNFKTYKGMCPIAEDIYKKILSLPIYFTLSRKKQDYVIKCIKDFFKNI